MLVTNLNDILSAGDILVFVMTVNHYHMRPSWSKPWDSAQNLGGVGTIEFLRHSFINSAS